MTFEDILKLENSALVPLAEQVGVHDWALLKRREFIFAIMEALNARNEVILAEGRLDCFKRGNFGFLRFGLYGFGKSPYDVYVSVTQINGLHLVKGDIILGEIRAPIKTESYIALLRIRAVNGNEIQEY